MYYNIFHKIWNFQLFQNGTSSILLNQVIIALTIIIVGAVISKKVSVLVRKKLQKTESFNENVLHIVQKVIYNVMLVIVMFIALPVAGIPITIFTVLGSAVAIGLGFGAQNLFNNLISSLFILIEKPIRIGDIIELSGEKGYVADIGNRCTRIRRVDGIDVLIPNSYFLEQPVVNWTLSDKDIRGIVKVGVSYQSDTKKVKELLHKSVYSQAEVHKEKDIKIIFEEFGASSLNFEVYFWTSVNSPIELKEIQSNIRFTISDLFRESGIEISYPQLDVHLNTKN